MNVPKAPNPPGGLKQLDNRHFIGSVCCCSESPKSARRIETGTTQRQYPFPILVPKAPNPPGGLKPRDMGGGTYSGTVPKAPNPPGGLKLPQTRDYRGNIRQFRKPQIRPAD